MVRKFEGNVFNFVVIAVPGDRLSPLCARTSARTVTIKSVSPWWRHQMETFSALLALYAGNSPVPVNSSHKGQWRGALMDSLIFVWINDWVNNRQAGDLRRHCGHDYTVWLHVFVYDKIMIWLLSIYCMTPMPLPDIGSPIFFCVILGRSLAHDGTLWSIVTRINCNDTR